MSPKKHKKSSKNFSDERLSMLNYIYTEVRESYIAKKEQLHAKTDAANLLLVTWAFVLSSIIGLFQAGILHSNNTQSVILLIATMIISVFTCVIATVKSDYEVTVPNVDNLWKEYNNFVELGYNNKYAQLQLKERNAGAFVRARSILQASLEKKSKRISFAAIILVIELGLLIFYCILPDFYISIGSYC